MREGGCVRVRAYVRVGVLACRCTKLLVTVLS